MKLLLFQLITGFTIGSIVKTGFSDLGFKIVDIVHKPTWRNPFHFHVILINEHGGIDFCGNKAIKSIFESNQMYSEIEDTLKKLK